MSVCSLLAIQATPYLLPTKARYSHIDRSLCFLSFTTAPANSSSPATSESLPPPRQPIAIRLNRGRQLVNFEGPNEYFPKSFTSANMDGSNGRERHQMVHSEIDMERYNEGGPTRSSLATSRTQSLYTQHPTIDFDGLSWPSE